MPREPQAVNVDLPRTAVRDYATGAGLTPAFKAVVDQLSLYIDSQIKDMNVIMRGRAPGKSPANPPEDDLFVLVKALARHTELTLPKYLTPPKTGDKGMYLRELMRHPMLFACLWFASLNPEGVAMLRLMPDPNPASIAVEKLVLARLQAKTHTAAARSAATLSHSHGSMPGSFGSMPGSFGSMPGSAAPPAPTYSFASTAPPSGSHHPSSASRSGSHHPSSGSHSAFRDFGSAVVVDDDGDEDGDEDEDGDGFASDSAGTGSRSAPSGSRGFSFPGLRRRLDDYHRRRRSPSPTASVATSVASASTAGTGLGPGNTVYAKSGPAGSKKKWHIQNTRSCPEVSKSGASMTTLHADAPAKTQICGHCLKYLKKHRNAEWRALA